MQISWRRHKHHIFYIDDNLLNSIFEFVKFPIKNEILISKWLKAMNKENFTPTKPLQDITNIPSNTNNTPTNFN
ncbi:unnamed protein product [Gordionus sp. m RMFG-2023]